MIGKLLRYKYTENCDPAGVYCRQYELCFLHTLNDDDKYERCYTLFDQFIPHFPIKVGNYYDIVSKEFGSILNAILKISEISNDEVEKNE